jgi:hypothetical protein
MGKMLVGIPTFLKTNKQCCESGMFIPYPNVFRPGSQFFPSRIPDPHQRILSILTQKMVSKLPAATLQITLKSRAELDFILTFFGSRDTKSLCSMGLRNALTALKIE